MSIDSSMDKMLQRRQEVEAQLSRSAELSNKQLADFSRELSELRPVCDQIELVRQLEGDQSGGMPVPSRSTRHFTPVGVRTITAAIWQQASRSRASWGLSLRG